MFFGSFVKQALPFLSPEHKKQFELEATGVYSRAIEYLEQWFDFENSISKKLECLNMDKLPSLDDILDLAKILAVEVCIKLL